MTDFVNRRKLMSLLFSIIIISYCPYYITVRSNYVPESQFHAIIIIPHSSVGLNRSAFLGGVLEKANLKIPRLNNIKKLSFQRTRKRRTLRTMPRWRCPTRLPSVCSPERRRTSDSHPSSNSRSCRRTSRRSTTTSRNSPRKS